MSNDKITVSIGPLTVLLTALNGHEHRIREIQATRGPLVGDNNPINILTDELNAGGATIDITEFRKAANSIGIEAGVISAAVDPHEIEKSVLGDTYYLELIAEAELRFKKLSLKYEKLRAISASALTAHSARAVNWNAMHQLQEVLNDELP